MPFSIPSFRIKKKQLKRRKFIMVFFSAGECCVNIFCRKNSDTGQNNENILWCGNSLEWIGKLFNRNFRNKTTHFYSILNDRFNDSAFGSFRIEMIYLTINLTKKKMSMWVSLMSYKSLEMFKIIKDENSLPKSLYSGE